MSEGGHLSGHDPRARTIRVVADMTKYRAREIEKTTRKIRSRMRIFHREVSTRKHETQVKELMALIDEIQRMVADNDFDIHYLAVHLKTPRGMPEPSLPERQTLPAYESHYIQ